MCHFLSFYQSSTHFCGLMFSVNKKSHELSLALQLLKKEKFVVVFPTFFDIMLKSIPQSF